VGSGGKVVANALGLSRYCLLQTADAQSWSTEQKWQFLRHRLMQAIRSRHYADFDLRSSEFVGTVVNSALYGLGGYGAWQQHYRNMVWHPQFVSITHGTQDFVIGSHNQEELDLHQSQWPQARSVRCTHGDAVCYTRPTWIPAHLAQQIVQWEDRQIQTDHSFDLRTVWHETDFLDAVKVLYDLFAYQDFDLCRPYLQQFRTMWTHTVRTITAQHTQL